MVSLEELRKDARRRKNNNSSDSTNGSNGRMSLEQLKELARPRVYENLGAKYNQSISKISEYQGKLQSGEALSSAQLRDYEDQLNSYFSTTEKLLEANGGLSEENEQKWRDQKYSMISQYDKMIVWNDNVRAQNGINEYHKKIQNGEFLSEADLVSYKQNLDSYISSNDKLIEYDENSQESVAWENQKYDLIKGYDQLKQYYASFEGQDHLDVYQMSLEELEPYVNDNADGIAYTTKDGQNITWQDLYDEAFATEDLNKRQAEYSKQAGWNKTADSIGLLQADYYLMQSLVETGAYDEDYADNAGISEEGFDKIEADRKYISEKYGLDLSDAKTRSSVLQEKIASTEFQNIMKYKYVDSMTEDEKAVLSYIYDNYGHDAALEWHKSREKIYEERARQQRMLDNMAFGEKYPVLGLLFSVVANVYSSPEQLYNYYQYIKTGELKENTNAAGASAVRSGVTKTVDWEIKGWDAFDFIYNTAMSGVDSYTSMKLMGPLAGFNLGLSAAASATNDALNRGMSSGQAFWTGLAAGTFEGVCESFSIGSFKAMKQVKASTWKDIAKNYVKLMGVNAQEEAATEIANIFYDTFANGDFSQWDTTVRQYEAQGMSHEAAMRKVWGDHILQVVEAGASGTLMGLGFGVVGNAGNVKVAKQNAKLTRAINILEKMLPKDASVKSNASVIQPGKVNFENDALRGAVSEDVLGQVQRIADATGRTINIYSGPSWQNGKYNEDTGEINVNINGADPVVQIVSHELTHSIETAGTYGKFSNLILKRIKAEGGNLDAMRQAKKETYAKRGVDLNDENNTKVDKEIVAEYVSKNLLTDEQSILSLTQESPSLGRRILQWLDSLIAKFGNKVSQERTFLLNARNLYAKALFQTQGSFNAETDTDTTAATTAPAAADGVMQTNEAHHSEENGAVADMSYEEMRQRAREMYNQGELSEAEYDEAMEQIDQLEEESAGNEEQHSINGEFADEISEWHAAGMRSEESFVLGTTGDVLQGLGAIESDIYMLSDKVKSILKDHPEMSINEIKKIPQILEDPILILKSKNVGRSNSKNTRLVVFGTVTAQNGQPVLTVLDLRPQEKNLVIDDMQKVSSAYTKDENPTGFLRSSDVVYADKKRTAKLLRSIGFQMPIELQQSGYIGSISYFQRSVNIDGKSFDEVFTTGEAGSTEQFSISDQISKQDVVSDLREILRRGGDPAELRRYVENMERGTESAAEVESADSQDTEVQEILNAAREQNISVDEYLRRNWEQYEYDGQLNATARAALDQEKGNTNNGFQYSIVNLESGYSYVQASRDIISGTNVAAWRSQISKFFNDALIDGPIEIETIEGDILTISKYTAEKARAKTVIEDGIPRELSDKEFLVKLHAEAHIDELAEISKKNKGGIKRDSKNHIFAKDGFTYRTVYFQDFDGSYYKITLSVGENNGISTVYNVGKIKADDIPDGKIISTIGSKASMSSTKFSISEPSQSVKQKDSTNSTVDKETANNPHSELPRKAQEFLKRTENRLINELGNKLGVPKFVQREYLRPIVQEISNEYLRTGTVSDEKITELFQKAYAEGIVVDADFYNQYKDLKKHLRTNAVTISEQDQSDIADYADFKQRARYTLRIVDKGGLPVDVAYQELHSMAQELFPESITHPAEQLVRMYEVARCIQITERSLQEYYGKEEPEFRRWAQNDFAVSVGEVMGDLRDVKRYSDERLAAEETAPVTVEEAMEAFSQLKAARRVVDKAVAKNLLTDHDNALVGDLLKGQITLENLDPDTCNVKGITAVYEAKQEYERINRLITKYKQQVKAELRKIADRYLETANDWKDKKTGIAYSRETMERNVLDIVPDRKLAKEICREFFESVRTAEAAATKMKTQFRNRVRELNLSTKVEKGNLVSEAHAVQLLGEARDNIRVLKKSRGIMKMRDGKTLQEWNAVIDNLWAENPDLDVNKIEAAIEEFRKIYDELFQMMNEVRVRYGYEPVNYRQGYFPHFQPGDGDGIMLQFGKAMGIDTNVAALPTTINGLTHMFRPGIQWFGNAHERLGFNTAYDAVEGFDKYIEGVASVIHQTENIQKLRALASQIRYRTSDEGLRKQVDAVYENSRLTEEEKQVQINDIYEHGKYALSNFVNELDEYTNLLANKKSRLDRTIEAAIGRKWYSIMKAWEARVGANMIAGNISSALTNIIPLTQANAQLDRGMLLRGMWAALQSYRSDDGIVAKSDFLTNRRGSDPLVKTWAQKTSEKLGTPMELIDTFVSDSIIRAAYLQNIKQGLSESEAMHQADIFAARVIAERSKGATPTLFQSSNPLIKAFTQFQLEVNNQFSEVFKDLPRDYADKGLAVLTMVLLKYFVGAWLFDEVYEYFIGRRPALDPIDILNNMIGDLTGYELPNVLELGVGLISGDMPSFETEKVGVGKAGTNLAKTTLAELPFSSGLNLIGVETDGGRIPVSSSIPDLSAIWDAATNEGWSAEKRWKEIQDELNKLAYVLPPFGGGQISKSWKGIKAFIEGGSYTVDAEGNKVLQYPVYNDNPGDFFWNMVRTAIMGKSSVPEAQDWVDSGFDGLSAKQTAVYQDMLEHGVKDRDAFDLLKELERAKKSPDKSKLEVQRDILLDADLSGEGKAIVFYGLLASESDREVMDKLADMDADTSEVAKVLMQISNANKLTGSEASITKRNVIADSALTDDEKAAIYHDKISESWDGDIAAFSSVGLSFNDFIAAQNAHAQIKDKYSTASERAIAYAQWVSDQNYTQNQTAVVENAFAFGGQGSRAVAFVEAGLNEKEAMDIVNAFGEMKPLEGRSQVTDAQRWRAIVDNVGSSQKQLAALSVVMSESHYEKVKIADQYDLAPDVYVQLYELLPHYDANGNGSYSQAEVEAAIDGMCGSVSDQVTSAVTGDKKARNLTDVQKAALWQLVTGSSSAKNNPYNVSVGNDVIAKRSK